MFKGLDILTVMIVYNDIMYHNIAYYYKSIKAMLMNVFLVIENDAYNRVKFKVI